MEKFYSKIIKYRKGIMVFFVVACIVCGFLQNFVSVNYNMNDYLPEHTASTVALNKMQKEFEGDIPNARVMIQDVTIPEALEYKEKISAVDGVEEITWLDDVVDTTIPTMMQDQEAVENYYKDNAALYSITIEKEKRVEAVSGIRKIIGDENAMTGSAVSTAISTVNTVSEISKITVIAIIFVLAVLLLTTTSWFEPVVVLVGLGVAITINRGTNLLFGEISFVTNAAGSILQLAVSLDYSVFLIHRFTECRKDCKNVKQAMIEALCKSTGSILSSGLTTVIGFLALILMQFQIGPDLGIVLAKGVAISLITVFTFMPALILATYRWIDKTEHKPLMPSFVGLGKVIRKISIVTVSIFGIIVIPAYLASNANSYHYGSSFIFGEGTEYGRDKDGIENVFGKCDTYVLLVPKGDTATETALSKKLGKLPEVTDVISYVDLAGAEIPSSYLDKESLELLESEHYSRMVLSVDTDYEGTKTFELIETIRTTAEKYYGNKYHLAGEGVSTYDLMKTVTADMTKVNLLAILAVFLVLALTMKSLLVPFVLVVNIEAAIWINLAVPYFSGKEIFYIAYLIISTIQLGATVDYAILLTERYKENRLFYPKKEAVVQTISDVTVSILTSGSTLIAVGFLLGYISTNGLLAQLGILIGRGALISLMIVLFVLPGVLMMLDKLVIKEKKMEVEYHETV